jgi:hypothetical protein
MPAFTDGTAQSTFSKNAVMDSQIEADSLADYRNAMEEFDGVHWFVTSHTIDEQITALGLKWA